MIGDLAYSYARAIEDYMPEVTTVHQQRDGLKVSGTPKPFATVRFIFEDPTEVTAMGRETYRETYRFQLGLYTRTRNLTIMCESERHDRAT